MNERELLAERFEAHRQHLRAVAYRMLGSRSEADDAVQEAWLNVTRSGANGVDNLGGWLTTVVARVCLDMLRSRKSRREESLVIERFDAQSGTDPEHETILADSVGLALLVVLEALAPAERIAFVLHDLFNVPFEEIATIVGRSPEATRQLASRARRRVHGARTEDAQLTGQRKIVEAFLEAMRAGDFEQIVAVLAPDVVVHADVSPGVTREVRGARNWAKGAVTFSKHARFVQAALVNGAIGVVFAPNGRLTSALSFTFADGKIATVDVISDPGRIRDLEVAVLTPGS